MPPRDSAGPVAADHLAFGFAGCHARVRGCDPALRARIVESLGRSRIDLAGEGEGRAAPVATFEVGGDAISGYSLRCASVGDSAANGAEQLAARLNAFDLRERLVYELTLALARGVDGWPVFHAAGLEWEGIGLLLAGVSGAGKSTLTTRLLSSGAGFLSDELVAVSPSGDRMVGFPRPIVLKDGGRALGPGWLAARLGVEPRIDPDGAVRVDAAGIRTGADPSSVRPDLLIFPRFAAGAAVSLRPVSRATAVFRLLPGLMNGKHFADRGLGVVSRALGGARAYALEYGDGDAAAETLHGLVDRTGMTPLGA